MTIYIRLLRDMTLSTRIEKFLKNSFLMEYNTTIANSDVFSDTKIEQLGLIASKYKTVFDKALLELKSQSL